MTVESLAGALGCEKRGEADALRRQVTCGYCGDLLSWVMGRAPADSAWVTVMGNVNAVAVAVLAGVACIILAEGARPDPDALKKAEENGVALLMSGKPAFAVACEIKEALGL